MADDPDYRPTPEQIRADQQADIRRVIQARGGQATVKEIAEDSILAEWSVKQRLLERPDWFQPGQVEGTWTLATSEARP